MKTLAEQNEDAMKASMPAWAQFDRFLNCKPLDGEEMECLKFWGIVPDPEFWKKIQSKATD